MASVTSQGAQSAGGQHQRAKSSVLRSFMMHRRNNSQGGNLTAAALVPNQGGGGPLEETSHNRQQPQMAHAEKHPMSRGNSASSYSNGKSTSNASNSPTKKTKIAGNTPPIETNTSEITNENDADNTNPLSLSPTKKDRARSTTNLVGLLSRPKSFKNLHKMAKEAAAEAETEEERGRGRRRGDEKKRSKSRLNFKDARDKENKALPNPVMDNGIPTSATPPQVTPIYAQFCSASKGNGRGDLASKPLPSLDDTALGGAVNHQGPATRPRPKSFHPVSASVGNGSTPVARPTLTTAFSSTRQIQHNGVNTPTSATPTVETPSSINLAIDPSDVDSHLEALLDRRNIPEHQRYKMRNLANSIKMELIRQDWAEERSKRQLQQTSDRPESHNSSRSTNDNSDTKTTTNTPTPTPTDDGSAGIFTKSKHSRVKSLTLSKVARGRSRDRGSNDSTKRPKSPAASPKKKTEGTLGRHLRSKSTESFVKMGTSGPGTSPDTTAATSNPITGFFAKAKLQNSPGDFVTYLRTVQAPEKMEVGKLHKLRLLLRNETVTWIEDFIGQGGMEEVVSLLHRILAVEWREEHEDALLHENLLCLKALCTTALALQYLHSIHASLLPALIHMIFDPEKKGPSEFTTRNIVTWVLFTYIQNAPIDERPGRAQTVLGYLRDPECGDDEKPVSFVMDMRKERPYRVWCKEVISVTKEVFWIFLHHLNVVSLPTSAKDCIVPASNGDDEFFSRREPEATSTASTTVSPPLPPKHTETGPSYMLRHFPQERPPVPAAPYVGGVEWEATNYLASHLDLVNAILACTPTAAERNHLRGLMQMSGWERCMGSSLRLCKEKFYGAVHDGLRVWVAAAYEDGWDVRDVRYGPPPPPATPTTERRSNSPNKRAPIVGGPKAAEPAPKLEIPKLDFILDGEGL
ncbi:hypothetical protein SPBR_02301 [Sporothrix brasiliensis 5110]|uniref:Formin GTPase-binding domain-containing protein n=1 Tax=Sporothrix brasiliensis 5110 TaxID=1398154 RepID=A0A0C2J017_9PEZI|nr:uncharacterized protein SPBR_02301 [Sporothrix brasiliensis 5110]KIH92345.1 hypothetical protein SPBR_02301 [Sporothrix brasiliensis 5110]